MPRRKSQSKRVPDGVAMDENGAVTRDPGVARRIALREREEALRPCVRRRGERDRTNVCDTRRVCHRQKGKRTNAATRR